MRATDIIHKKREGQPLTRNEIEWFIQAYTTGEIPDYQAAAWLMAIFFNGMSREETVNLTLAMARSGQMLDLSDITDYAIDKHSSGGVGDKTTLVALPLVASFGVPIAKMSGRGLGFSGGTLDKLEAIANFNVNLTDDEFHQQARLHGLVLAGQTGELAPADGKLYALRDVTDTVDCLPLIASSIMSKKLAAGANGIVLDVKLGRGAFMPDLDAARELAQVMVDIGTDAGRDMVALLSDMNQPLGNAVGNALEVIEAIETLQGGGSVDFYNHTVDVSAYMLKLAGQGRKWQDIDENKSLLMKNLSNGKAFDLFKHMVEIQGGDTDMIDDPAKLPQAKIKQTITAQESGYVSQVWADEVAHASLKLGAGRMRKEDPIDPAVGIVLHVAVGDEIKSGQPLATIHANDDYHVQMANRHIETAIAISESSVDPLPLFYDIIDATESQ